MNREKLEQAVERINVTRREIIDAMDENGIAPNEALSLLSGMLVEFYSEMVVDANREDFISTLGQCFDTYTLLNAEPEGSVQ